MAEVRPIPLGRELAGRAALVTGASANIGRAIALALAEAGAAVAVHARQSLAGAQETLGMIEAAGGRGCVLSADLSDRAAAHRLVEDAADRLGRLDILVHNAALRGARPLADLTEPDWRAVMAVGLDAAVWLAQAAAPRLARSEAGAIVTIGGMSAHAGAPGRAHVVAAKAGLAGLVRALAMDLAPDGITVNAVVPGVIDTMRGGSAGAVPQQAGTLLGRPGEPAEVAAMVRLLAGPGGRFVTGQTIHVNGGAYRG